MDGKRGSKGGSGDPPGKFKRITFTQTNDKNRSRTPPGKQKDPPPPKEISKPKHRWILIKKSIENEIYQAYFK